MTVSIGKKASDFTLPRDGGGTISLSEFKGQKIILYFYPKDDTSGCTAQACDFTENIASFNKLGAQVIGLSKDSVKKHDKFRDKYGLKFPLASDEDSAVCSAYGVWVEKSMYGRKYMGIERTTFLIDESGKITHIWNKVKVPGHVDEVKKALKG
ncbi:MAG: thioredoxin-dependent thiol peroxidase [Micavibrio aeruginosavorus]|uniref:thioredoxin-dependent peroxiredoxin n=1 Tax=Micavibrio aeruginosavorus TaxID=349221 RepID=A0A2W5FQV4_9BACT|nr:MAG: thioredoxin-dependent thiol peroxidase [Micavibrio aeruginosavorus]